MNRETQDARTATPDLLRIGAVMLMLSASWQLFDSVAIAWVVFPPGVYLSVKVLGGSHVPATVWLIVYIALLAAVLLWRFRSGVWRRIDLTGHGAGRR